MRSSLATRITTATTDREPASLACITDETASVVMSNAHRTARALIRTTSTLTATDADDIAVTGATLALLRVADAITTGAPHDSALMARESTRVAFLDARGDALTSREATSALDWTGDDGDVRTALTAQVPAADAHLRWTRRDALAVALDDSCDITPDAPGMPAGHLVRRLLSWKRCIGAGCDYRSCDGTDAGARHYVTPGDDGRAWRGENGSPSVVPALDALGLPSSGRRRAASVAVLADALAVVGEATREAHAGWTDADRAARWTDRAVTWSQDARRACQAVTFPQTASDAERFHGTASAPVITRPAQGPTLPGAPGLGTVTHAIVPGEDGAPVVRIITTDAERAAVLARPSGERPTTDRAADRAALALAPLAGVRAESTRKSKRGGGVGGPTLQAGWQAGWAEKRA